MAGYLDAMLSYEPVYDNATTSNLENDFGRTRDECYLDHAGATLYSDNQLRNVFGELHQTLLANPHSIGLASSLTDDIIERMRYRILDHFHTSPDEYSVIFTSGATASLKVVAETFLFRETGMNGDDCASHFVYTQDNHTSVLGMREVVAARGATVTCLNHTKAFDTFNKNFQAGKCNSERKSNSLFVYPAQCNFSGMKYPLEWVECAQNGILFNGLCESPTKTKWYVLLDAAAFVGTNDLNLSTVKPDFVCLSFYKMFGYPTGIGALLVKNSSSGVLQKTYYGGGTVDVALSSEMFHVNRGTLHKRFEDGTVPFLSIVSLRYGLDILDNITMGKISKHVFSLAKHLHHSLLTLHHSNGEPVAELYCDTNYEDRNYQGGIVAFNLRRSTGEYVGYMEILSMAALFKIHLRTGCFCNPGTCQRHLNLSSQEVLQNYSAGYTCGGAADLIEGRPTGAIRVSFGYMSSIKDVRILLHMIKECFVSGEPVKQVPQRWENHDLNLNKKFGRNPAIICNTFVNDKLKGTTNDDDLLNLRHTEKLITQNPPIQNGLGKATEIKCTLEHMYIYPIKSCAAYEVTEPWKVNSKGLEYDREWMIVTSAGTCLTQKHEINLCLLRPVICKKKNAMLLNYPGMPMFELTLLQTSKTTVEDAICRSRICGHKVEGIDCGNNVSEWLSLALGKPNLRLVRQNSTKNVANNLKKPGTNKPELSFSSQAQYLLINKASVSWLADQVPDPEFQRDTVLPRFRGNIVVSGCKPFEETQWKHICIGKNQFTITGPCTRCQMICIDQTTGIKTAEPLRTLAETFHGKLKFGIYLTRENMENGTISIGDIVQITE